MYQIIGLQLISWNKIDFAHQSSVEMFHISDDTLDETNKMLFGLFLLVVMWLLNFLHAQEIPLIQSCHHNDVTVKCAPVCPKLCSSYYYNRRCIPKKCERGCACKKGWLRYKHTQGICIPKEKCKRYII
nr:mucin-6 [Drosophila takahashii]